MLICMRTTLNLDDRLIKAARKQALTAGTTLTALIELALRELLAQRRQPPSAYKLQWVIHTGGGVQPGVDLDDRDSLFDRMEGRS